MFSVTGNNLFLCGKNSNSEAQFLVRAAQNAPLCITAFRLLWKHWILTRKKEKKNQSQQHFSPHTAIRCLPLPKVAYLSRLQLPHVLWPSHDPLL